MVRVIVRFLRDGWNEKEDVFWRVEVFVFLFSGWNIICHEMDNVCPQNFLGLNLSKSLDL